MAVIYREKFEATFSPAPTPYYEALHFTLAANANKTFKGILLYRPPGARSTFTNNLDALMEAILSTDEFTILGDFNIYLEDSGAKDTNSLLETLGTLGLSQLVLEPTHEAGHTLDGILTSVPGLKINDVHPLTWTDHSLVIFNYNIPKAQKGGVVELHLLTYKAWNKADKTTLCIQLDRTRPVLNVSPELAATQYRLG